MPEASIEPRDARRDEPVWTQERLKNPHAVADKQRRVRDMFAAIAPRYDFNNRLHSLGTDQRWRRKAVKLARLTPRDVIVDVACGTGDLTLEFTEGLWWAVDASVDPTLGDFEQATVVGIDYTFEMLPLAKGKARRAFFPSAYLQGDAQNLPLPDACCDVLSIAFGIRNVADPNRAMREFRRVLRPGGRVVVLEFSRPTNRLVRAAYDFYCNQVMTRTASWIARDKTGAYRYLSKSVETFKSPQQMKADLEQAGFADVETHPLTFGVATIFVGFVRR